MCFNNIYKRANTRNRWDYVCECKIRIQRSEYSSLPEVVDEKLEFIAARKSVFKKKKTKTFVEQEIVESVSYDKDKDKIDWGMVRE